MDDYIDELNPYGYQPFTMEELLDELMKSSYLFDSVPYFFAWASKVLTTKSASKKSTGKPHLLNEANTKTYSEGTTKRRAFCIIHDYREPFRSAVVLALTPISSRCVCRFA